MGKCFGFDITTGDLATAVMPGQIGLMKCHLSVSDYAAFANASCRQTVNLLQKFHTSGSILLWVLEKMLDVFGAFEDDFLDIFAAFTLLLQESLHVPEKKNNEKKVTSEKNVC